MSAEVVSDDGRRAVRKIDEGCLIEQTISGSITFPQKDVLTCAEKGCTARSDHVGRMPCLRMGPG